MIYTILIFLFLRISLFSYTQKHKVQVKNAFLEENSIKFLKDGNFEAQRKKINKNFVL